MILGAKVGIKLDLELDTRNITNNPMLNIIKIICCIFV